MSVDILLATYNGEKYLKEQIDSILNQSYSDFTLWIRDDLSTDNTLTILSEYASKDSRIRILKAHTNLGAVGNFKALMEASSKPYVAFADQDDVWHPDKLKKLMAAASKQDTGLPLLLHHDLTVVDENLRRIHPSFWEFTHLNPNATTLPELLMQNNVTGCACLMNRPLVELSLAMPKEAIMHDGWVALVASSFGHIIPLQESLILYRQHARNQIGAKSYSSLGYIQKGLNKLFKIDYSKNYLQAEAFVKTYQSSLSEPQKELLLDFLSLPTVSFFKSRKIIFQRGFWKQGLLRNITFFITPYKI